MAERKHVLLRLDPAVHDALQRWARDELRSVNAQIEVLLRQQLQQAGRLPSQVQPIPKRGRPPKGQWQQPPELERPDQDQPEVQRLDPGDLTE